MPGRYGQDTDRLVSCMALGWQYAQSGEVRRARAAYAEAESTLPHGIINPDLSILRHNVGQAKGVVAPVPPTEDHVVSLFVCANDAEESSVDGLTPSIVDEDALTRNIAAFIALYDPKHHRANLAHDLPHVLVLSTGRCGTVSLYRLLREGRVVPYHTYWWQPGISTHWQMMCRLMAGIFDNMAAPDLWAAMRAAEWLAAMGQGRPMVGLNHLDTIFAPVFAAIHPRAKFVHLRRDPVAVFGSFYGKNQWGESQLRPIDYGFGPEFRFRRTAHDLPACLAWYVHFTETFARAMGRVMGERYIEISSDKLFARDRDEIGWLLEFTGAGIGLDDAMAHFSTKINEKAHKVAYEGAALAEPRFHFEQALAYVQQTGRL